MRVITQVVVLAILGGGGYTAYQYREQIFPPAASQQQQARRGGTPTVVVAAVKTGRIEQRMEAVGTARSNESITVTAKDAARISTFNFTEGALIERGAVLFEQDTSERRADVEQARSQRESARANREDVKARLDRAKQLRASGNVTEARLDELEAQFRSAEAVFQAAEARLRATEARLSDMRVVAPFTGRVGLRLVSPGAMVQPGTAITTLDDIQKIKVEFALPETVLAKVGPGTAIEATAAAYPNRVFNGAISVIDTRIDPITRSFRVNAEFDNREESLKPGLFLNVTLILASRENAILVPEEAVVPLGSEMFVFVIKDNRAERRTVKLGIRRQGDIEILDGLRPGEQVVVQGIQKVRDKQPVQVARPQGAATS